MKTGVFPGDGQQNADRARAAGRAARGQHELVVVAVVDGQHYRMRAGWNVDVAGGEPGRP